MSEPWHEDAEKGWNLLSWEGEAQWFARRDDKVLGGRLRSLDALIGTIRNAEALGWNLYLNANPTRHVPGKKKLSREDVTYWRYVVVDLDPTVDALEPPHPSTSPCRGCSDEWLQFAHRIFSGRGYQYWLPVRGALEYLEHPRLMGPWQVNGTSYERRAQGYLAALAAQAEAWAPGWKVDPACSDLARVVRCPGSINQRTGRRSTVEHMGEGAVPVAELERYSRPEEPKPPQPFTPTENVNLMVLLPHLNVRAKTFILGGADPGERHRACYATCKNLQELGVSSGRSQELLMLGAGWSGLAEREVVKIVRQVYGGEL
jgi:hypothetical protein